MTLFSIEFVLGYLGRSLCEAVVVKSSLWGVWAREVLGIGMEEMEIDIGRTGRTGVAVFDCMVSCSVAGFMVALVVWGQGIRWM